METFATHGFTLTIPGLISKLREPARQKKPVACQLPGIPLISILDNQVTFADMNLNLLGKPKMQRLFTAFIDTSKGEIHRSDILRALYPREHLSPMTQRIRIAMERSLLKLISRARRLALKHLSQDGAVPIDWLVYDSGREVWQLCRMRNEYLMHIGFPEVSPDDTFEFEEIEGDS